MANQLRIGFIGCGNHATRNLYPCIEFAPIRLVAACDLNEERLANIARAFGPEQTFTSYQELLHGPELDAVFVCGPPELHQEASIAALNAGYPVFMEKPPAPTLKGALEVQEAARQNAKPCMVGFMKRFGLRYADAKAISQTPEFGELTQVTVKYSHWNCQSIEHMLLYMCVHPFDLFRFFLGDLERIAFEKAENKGQFSFSAVARAKSGAIGNLVTSAQEPHVKEHAEIVGEGQLVIVRNVVELEYHRKTAPRNMHVLGEVDLIRPDFAIPGPQQSSLYLQGYAGEIIEFANALLEGREPSVTIDDAVKAMRLVDLYLNNGGGVFDVSAW